MKLRKKLYFGWQYISGGWAIKHLFKKADADLQNKILGDFKAYSGLDRLDFVECVRVMNDKDKKTFRDVYEYRTRDVKGCELARKIYLHKFPVNPAIDIASMGEIGPGLRLEHGYCVIGFTKAGKNLNVFQGVTVGRKGDTGIATVGDDVSLYANCILLGGIHIGDRAKVAAGAVVLQDVPDDCVAVGNPARIIYPKEK